MKLKRIAASTLTALLLAQQIAHAQLTAADPAVDWRELGFNTYVSNCAACHGQAGAGVPGVFPPLAGHVTELLSPNAGRTLLADVLLYGLTGPIEVGGVAYNGAMPDWAHLSDEQLAAVLNHISLSWGNADAVPSGFEPYSPNDVAAERNKGFSATDMLDVRATVLGLASSSTDQSTSSSIVVLLDDSTGYYTDAQAARGESAYMQLCAECHGANLRGFHSPSLTQLGFFRKWGELSMDPFAAYIQAQMPQGRGGSLSGAQVADILAFWMRFHNYPAGDREVVMSPELLRAIPIERR